MAELIEPADAEAVVIQYLAGVLGADPDFSGVLVTEALPPASTGYRPPPECLEVRGTGGTPVHPGANRHQLTLTGWGETADAGERANGITRRALAYLRAAENEGFLGATPCAWLQVLSLPYKDPDPTTGRARYSTTVAVSLRGRKV